MSGVIETVLLMNRAMPRLTRCKLRNLTLPGPTGFPILGNIHQTDAKQLPKMCTKWSKIYGNVFKFKLLGSRIIVISDPDILRKAFSCEHLNDRSKNSTSRIFNGRQHVGFADFGEKTVSLRHILKKNVLTYQMKQDAFQNRSRTASDTFVDKCLKREQDINVDRLLKEYLSALYSILVS